MLRKLLGLSFVAIVAGAAVVIIRTLLFVPQQQPPQESISYPLDEAGIVKHMSEAITFPTVSFGNETDTPREPFEKFITWLAEAYPLVHSQLSVEHIGPHSLLYKWQGDGTGGKPILLTAHYDVVPVPQSSRDQWRYPPFAGEVNDGAVWGRGALDDKSAVIAIMEALTLLLSNDHAPQRDVYVAFGHDEEVGGANGAGRIVQVLRQRNIQFAWSLDEGSFVLDRIIPGLNIPLAAINVTEKGFLTIEIIAKSVGGHSSMPPKEMAIYTLAEVLDDLRKAPFDLHLGSGPSMEMYQEVARFMPFTKRMIFANQWLFGALLENALSKNTIAAAMLHTTIAPTMLRAGIKENILPPKATATVNLRIHPQDSVDAVIARLKQVIERDGVSVEILNRAPASRISSADSAGFTALALISRKVFGHIVVAPGLTIAGTDSKHYEQVADDAYRFNPMMIDAEDLETFHGVNERISIDNLLKATTFYTALIESPNR